MKDWCNLKEFKRNDKVYVMDAKKHGRVSYPLSYTDLKDCLPAIAAQINADEADMIKPFYQVMIEEDYFIVPHNKLMYSYELN